MHIQEWLLRENELLFVAGCFMVVSVLCQWIEAEQPELNIDSLGNVPANKDYSKQGIPPAADVSCFVGQEQCV